uniref:hypothetical protein n=1 Tax=Ningiella ruwaisensis TaxID=2364274 RepID=UPI0014489AFB|nr:hypothetical protein [Ningiella ruwaisensis]
MFYINAAAVAAQLHKAKKIAQRVMLASSNAGVLAFRAGQSAAGFGALTSFISELAKKTVKMSDEINTIAIDISKLSTYSLSTQSASEKMHWVMKNAERSSHNSAHIESLVKPMMQVDALLEEQEMAIAAKVRQLSEQLSEMKKELSSAKIIGTMSLMESTQAESQHRAALADNAKNIVDAATEIEQHVDTSLALMKAALLAQKSNNTGI